MVEPVGYVASNVYCERCGKIMPGKTHSAKYCLTCAPIIRLEQSRAVAEHRKRLAARDTVKPSIGNKCQVCGINTSAYFTFCFNCGQRLLEEKKWDK